MGELLACLVEARVRTLVDVRRFPGSRRNPQFNQGHLADGLGDAGIGYRHAVELGGRRSGEPGEERFDCIRTPAFRSYAARMTTASWVEALHNSLGEAQPACYLCAETLPWQCHRHLIADLLTAHGNEVVHLIRPGELREHRLLGGAEARDGRLYLCGELVG